MIRENIVMMVMTTGEHIIGEKTAGPGLDGDVTIENPVSLMPDPNSQNRGRLIFIPYLQFTEKTTATFPAHTYRHVLDEVKEDLKNNYAEQYGDGIHVPQKQVILS